MRELERAVGLSLSGVDHHVRGLEKERRVVTISDRYFRRCFLTTLELPAERRRLDEGDRRILAECRRPTALSIVLNVAAEGALRPSELAARLGRSPSTVSYHIARLRGAGILQTVGETSEERYDLVNRPRTVSLLVTFSDSFRDHVDGFAALWLSLRADSTESR